MAEPEKEPRSQELPSRMPGSVGQRLPRLARWLESLRSSYWFLPSVAVLAYGVGSVVLLWLDRAGALDASTFPEWIRIRETEVARSILTTIASATITIVSLTFSIAIVALTLASSQFGSRVLYHFMRDRQTQLVLGHFLGTFLFCLMALVALRSDASTPPQLVLTGAFLLSLASIALLIFFLHHMADAMQATTVVRSVGRDLVVMIRRMLPEEDGPDGDSPVADPPEDARPVYARRSGTLQAVDGDGLVELARREDLDVWLRCRPGDFVPVGGEVARVAGPPLTGEVEDELRGALLFGTRRTLVQDLEFGFCQLVEIAVRAMSPGINAPFNAIACIDELGNALGVLAGRGSMVRRLADAEGRVRVRLDVTDFSGIAGTAFDQVRQQSHRDPAVMLHVLETLRRIVPRLRTPAQRAAVLDQGRRAHELARRSTELASDRGALDERLRRLERALASG